VSAGRGQQYGVVGAHSGIDVTAVLQLSDETSLFVPLHMNIYGRGKASLRTLRVRAYHRNDRSTTQAHRNGQTDGEIKECALR